MAEVSQTPNRDDHHKARTVSTRTRFFFFRGMQQYSIIVCVTGTFLDRSLNGRVLRSFKIISLKQLKNNKSDNELCITPRQAH